MNGSHIEQQWRDGQYYVRRNIIWLALGFVLVLAALIAAAPNQQHDRSDHLRIGIQLEPPNLDPTAGAAEAIDAIVLGNIFEGLTRITHQGQLAPALAKKWTISDDGLTYNFDLHENVTFHNGHPFSAKDVVYSFERARAKGSRNAQQGLFRKIDAVEIISETQIRIKLREVFPTFLTLLAWGDAVIVEEGSSSTNAFHPVGTGPFKFVEWKRSTGVDLILYNDYWGEKPTIQQATFRFIPDPTVAQVAMRSGDIDVFAGYPAPENFSWFVQSPDFGADIGWTEGETILAINHRRPELAKLKVRRALSHLVNKQEVLQGTMFGYGQLISSHFPPNRKGYIDLSSVYPFDPVKANALLGEVGFSETLVLILPPPAYARRSGEIIAAQLRAGGIKVRVENVEWAQWIDQVFLRHDYDLTIVAHTEPMDINIYARSNYYFGYENPEFVATINLLQQTSNEAQRDILLGEAQTILTHDAVNVFLFQLPALTVCRRGIRGVWQNSPIAATNISHITIDPVEHDAPAQRGCN